MEFCQKMGVCEHISYLTVTEILLFIYFYYLQQIDARLSVILHILSLTLLDVSDNLVYASSIVAAQFFFLFDFLEFQFDDDVHRCLQLLHPNITVLAAGLSLYSNRYRRIHYIILNTVKKREEQAKNLIKKN